MIKHKIKISFYNRDKLALLMPIVNPKVTIDEVARLCYGQRKDGSEYIRKDDLIKWFEAQGCEVKLKYEYSPCYCGIEGCENVDPVYYVKFIENPYTNLIQSLL